MAVAVAVSVIVVPLAVPALTWYERLNGDVAPAAKLGFVHVRVGAV